MNSIELVKSSACTGDVFGFNGPITISATVNLQVSSGAFSDFDNSVWVEINCDPNDPNVGTRFGLLVSKSCDISQIKEYICRGIAKAVKSLISNDGSGCIASEIVGILQDELN